MRTGWRKCHNPWKSRHIQDLVRNNEYLRNGKIVPPSDMAKAKLRSDRDLWIYAAEVELAALDDHRLQVFEHELTHNNVSCAIDGARRACEQTSVYQPQGGGGGGGGG
eukprot:SAG11_NODE_3418_length_2460_cov_2.180008_1_plen_108_part_00